VLLDGQPDDVMIELEGKTPGIKLEYIRHAIAQQLPIIASLRQQRLRDLGQPERPPAGLKRI
jgi:hypothetical protein